MRIDWKARRTQVVAGVVLAGLLAWSVADGAFRTWGQWDYIGWWVLVPLLVLLFATLITFLMRTWGKRD